MKARWKYKGCIRWDTDNSIQ